jgi:hypothetical protein
MPASNEWQEYHLTPRGWESGSHREDGAGRTNIEPPADRVLTTRWEEIWSFGMPMVEKRLDTMWQSEDKKAIELLLKQFGESPKGL